MQSALSLAIHIREVGGSSPPSPTNILSTKKAWSWWLRALCYAVWLPLWLPISAEVAPVSDRGADPLAAGTRERRDRASSATLVRRPCRHHRPAAALVPAERLASTR